MADKAKLVTEGGIELPLLQDTSTIGRPDQASGWRPSIDLTALDLNHKSSRRHAEIRSAKGSYLLKDLGSANRTFLNGQPLQPNVDYPLSEGDTLTFGEVALRIVGIAIADTGLRCPKCAEPVTADQPVCGNCGANLTRSTMTVQLTPAHPCLRCGRPTHGDEHCGDCAKAVAEADAELLALSGLKRKK